MPIRLRVIQHRGQPSSNGLEAEIGEAGGSVGRREGHALVLREDATVSRDHGRIEFENGVYVFIDSSSNGTRVPTQGRTVNNERIVLCNGDRLEIGDYGLEVTIEQAEHVSAPPVWDPMPPKWDGPVSPPSVTSGLNFPGPPRWPSENSALFTDSPAETDPFIELLMGVENRVAAEPSQPHQDEYLAGILIQENGAAPAADRVLHEACSPISSTSIEPLLLGAGLGPDFNIRPEDVPAVLLQVGALLRAFTEGLTAALHARAELKKQLRVSVTTINAVDNNPLKFCASVDQALKIMLGPGGTGFKDPVEGVREGFADLVNHQLAMNAGIQGALGEILRRFDPTAFEKNYTEGIVFQRKSKCWDDYREAYPGLVSGAFDDVFGSEFADVYEKQMAALRASRHKSES